MVVVVTLVTVSAKAGAWLRPRLARAMAIMMYLLFIKISLKLIKEALALLSLKRLVRLCFGAYLSHFDRLGRHIVV